MKRKLLPFIGVCLIFTLAVFHWFPNEKFYKDSKKWNHANNSSAVVREPYRFKKLGDYIGISEVLSSGENVIFPLQCETCALVGTSGHLLEYHFGSEIDNHSCVFRFGFSPTRGFEEYIGYRTTARVVDSFSGKQISSLWFATRVIEDSGCKTLNVYGIPDFRICKRHLNVNTSCLYWDTQYANLCSDGVDSSFKQSNSKNQISFLPTVA